MSVTFRKAGEAAVSKAVVVAKQPRPLGMPRAVTKEEAPYILPARESTKVTMMPWRGWMARLMQDTLGEERYQKLRRMFLFQPDDEMDLLQQPYPNMKFRISNDDPNMTAMFRYPSPGSQEPVRIHKQPGQEEGGDPYNNNYYPRDTRRRYSRGNVNPMTEFIKLSQLGDSPEVEELKKQLLEGPPSSPGNKGRFATGPTDFDPTGLRAAMSTNHAALNKSLDAHMPDHLPTPIWHSKIPELMKWYQDRDLPIPIGGVGFCQVPKHARVARW